MKDTKVASVQFEHAPGDKQANLDKVRRFTAEAAEQGVELVVFPEMCVTGYWHLRDWSREQLTALAEPVPAGPTTEELLRLAKRHNLSLGAGLLEISDEGDFNPQDLGSNTWDIYDAEGRYLGDLTFPGKYQPIKVMDDRIYGIACDELDVQSMKVYRVVME